MSQKKKSLFVIVLLLLVGLTAAYVSNTYAKYTSTIDDNSGTVTVAKWAFASDNASQELTIDFTDTYDVSTLADGKIAPGTSGSFNIALVNTNTETGVDFTLKIKSATNVPTNLKFYADETFSTEIEAGTGSVTGQLAANDSEGLTVPVYWKWEYETAGGDSADTSDGEAAKTLSIVVELTGVQTAPSTTAITSHID